MYWMVATASQTCESSKTCNQVHLEASNKDPRCFVVVILFLSEMFILFVIICLCVFVCRYVPISADACGG